MHASRLEHAGVSAERQSVRVGAQARPPPSISAQQVAGQSLSSLQVRAQRGRDTPSRHVSPGAHGGSQRRPESPGMQRKRVSGAQSVSVRMAVGSLTWVQHPDGQSALLRQGVAQRRPTALPQSTHEAVAGQMEAPQRIDPVGAPVSQEASTQAPEPGRSTSSTQTGVPGTEHGRPGEQGGAQRQSPAARQTLRCPDGHGSSAIETQASMATRSKRKARTDGKDCARGSAICRG